MTVRVGHPTDEPALRVLQAHLREPSPTLLAHGLRDGGVLVDEATVDGDDGRVGGDGGATGDPTATVPVGYLLAVDGDGTHVAELVVHPARRREGRATALFDRLFERTTGPVTLLVAADNDPARRLYADLGFHRVERRPGFYDDGTDALLLARDVAP
ncbi:GNAT family N-acetyltransferase [Halobaculum marinum]|uniref:GNAT family N-acetyltransferase n=1 Tax=Halobaculum marinum TaxID=3031996 RepID=A0ABD5WT18_9EURY|nr:GNAT family N-acetyltransferase [Halobaculum sp. DT55]